MEPKICICKYSFILSLLIPFFIFNSCSGVARGSKIAIKKAGSLLRKPNKPLRVKPISEEQYDDHLNKLLRYFCENSDDILNVPDATEGWTEDSD